MLLKLILVILNICLCLTSVRASDRQFDLRIPQEIWMSKPGATHEISVPLLSNTEISSGSWPFRQNQHTRMRLRSNGCSCQDLICGCCLDFNIAQFNFQRTGCMNITVEPREFAVSFNMLWEEESIFQNVLSGKNPPPVCIPLPIPYIPNMDACVRIFDISVLPEEQRVHACLDLDARIQRAPILVLHFDCLQVGTDANVTLVKPTAATV